MVMTEPYPIYQMQSLNDYLSPFWVSRNENCPAYVIWANHFFKSKPLPEVQVQNNVTEYLKERYDAVLRHEETYDYESVNWKYRNRYDWKIYFQTQEDMLAFILEWS